MAHTDDLKEILAVTGLNLLRLRTTEALPLETVAAAMGIEAEVLHQIEKGTYDWDIELIGSLCAFYNITLEALFTRHSP